VEGIYSHPQALGQCRRFLERCFPRARLEAALSANNVPPGGYANFLVPDDREQVAEAFASWDSPTVASEFCEDSLLVTNSASARSHEAQAAGTWWIQSESSAMPVDILNPQPDETVLDVCSGRGNKAMQTAARRPPWWCPSRRASCSTAWRGCCPVTTAPRCNWDQSSSTWPSGASRAAGAKSGGGHRNPPGQSAQRAGRADECDCRLRNPARGRVNGISIHPALFQSRDGSAVQL